MLPVFLDLSVENFASEQLYPCQCSGFILPHQAGIPDHVGCQYGGKSRRMSL